MLFVLFADLSFCWVVYIMKQNWVLSGAVMREMVDLISTMFVLVALVQWWNDTDRGN